MNLTYNRFCLVLVLSLAVIGCSKSNNADPQAAPIGTTDTNRFWLFPNPGRDPASSVFTTNEASYAQAYYDAIDPTDAPRWTMHGTSQRLCVKAAEVCARSKRLVSGFHIEAGRCQL